jgi:hypothetical protein
MPRSLQAQGACPQCGAGLALEVGDPILACPYCRTRLYISSGGPLRYRLGAASPEAAFYLPFWRLRGLRFRVVAEPPGVHGSLLDATVAGWTGAPPEASLGARPQLGPLRLAGAARATLPRKGAAAALEEAEKRLQGVEVHETLFHRFIGGSRTVIDAPFTLENTVDGFLLREALPDGRSYPLSREDGLALRASLEAPSPEPSLSFLPLVCPECASTLPADPGAVAFLCGRCTRGWQVLAGRLVPLAYAARSGRRRARLFPFWELAFTAEELGLRRRSDLHRWVAAYRRAPAGREDEPCRFLVPGFKLQPQSFLRVARVLTLAPLDAPDEPLSPGRSAEAEPVRLPYAEAAQALKVVLAAMAPNRARSLPGAAAAHVRVSRHRLVYLPFGRRGADWVDEQAGFALPAASVSRGAAL